MPVPSAEALQQYLRRLCDLAVPPQDAVLLKRFVTANDRKAFELLIARHGPMVLGSARRLVDKSHDAEDVFQAVFLSLARLAKTIRRGQTLPAWLHKATCRIAAKVRANRPRRSLPLRGESAKEPCDQRDPADGLIWQEVRQVLDEELQRLPDRLRSPLVLCYLSGLTRDEAAQQLGWSLGTLKRRLEEGRKALRLRLERRGIAAVGLALTVLTPESLQAALSKSLLESSLSLVVTAGTAVPATISALVLSSAGAMQGVAMKSILALVVVIAIGVGIYAGTGQDLGQDPPADSSPVPFGHERKPAPHEENAVAWDDRLPAGSTLRFGTTRFQHGMRVATMAVSPDGKRAFIVNDSYYSRAFDLVTGQAIFSLNLGEVHAGAFSPDGQTLVVKQGFALNVRDAVTGKETRSIELTRTNSYKSEAPLEFTPDGKTMAMTPQGKVVHLIDYESGRTIRDFAHENPESALNDFQQVLAIAFSPDGKWMATGGYANDKNNYFARLWEVETGKELRRFMHGQQGYGIGSLAFSPDGKTLATLGTQGGVFLRLFDVDTGKLRKEFPKDGNQRPSPRSVAFTPDGKTVAAALASIHLYDTTTGRERLRIDRKAGNLQFTDGGKTLTGAVDGAIYRWDTATGKALTPDGADSVVDQILVNADGKRVITRGQNGYAHIWDGASGKHLRRFQAGWQRSLAISPDGRYLAWPVDDYNVGFTDPQTPGSTYYGSRIRVYEIAADKFVDRFPTFKGTAQDLAFTGDGKKLVTIDQHPGMVRIWDFEGAKEVRSFPILLKEKEKAYIVVRALLAPDGKAAGVTYQEHSRIERWGLRGPPQHVRLWDVVAGRELPGHGGGKSDIKAFSADGRHLFTSDGSVLERASGRLHAVLPGELHIRAAAFSRDGRFLATTTPGDAIQLWETATWTKRHEYKGHRDAPTTLAFTPSGQLLSGSLDTTVLAWDTRPPRVAESVTLESAWNDLAASDAAESFKSEGRFVAAPADAVKFFGEKVKPVEALDPKQIQRLLADLGSEVFAVRDAASKALRGLDEQAKPYLEATLKGADSVEVRRRVQRILEQHQRAPLPSEQLRRTRAVMLLELIGDGASKSLLNRWAGGPVGALLTTEAAAALTRLEGAAKAKR